MQLGDELSQDLLAGASWWGGSRFCGPMNIIIFPRRDGFEKNQLVAPFSF